MLVVIFVVIPAVVKGLLFILLLVVKGLVLVVDVIGRPIILGLFIIKAYLHVKIKYIIFFYKIINSNILISGFIVIFNKIIIELIIKINS